MDKLQQIADIRRALNELQLRGESFKENLVTLKNLIDTGQFASENVLETFSKNFLGFMEETAACFRLYGKVFGERLPENFAAMAEILNAQEKKIRESDVTFLASKFLRFVTNSPAMQEILDEHSQNLKRILERKRQSAKTKVMLEMYAKFVKTVEENDFGKKFSMCKQLSEFFNDDFIGRGILGKELILTESADEIKSATDIKPAAKIKSVDEIKSAVDETKPVAKVKSGAETKSVVETKPVAKTKSAKSGKKTQPVEEPQPAAPEEESEFVKAVAAADALLVADDFARWEERFVFDKNERSKEFSAAKFKHDFKNPEILKPILAYVATHGMLASPALCPKKMPPDLLENIAQLLLKRGYLQKYSITDVASFYTMTKNFSDFVKTDNGKKFIAAKKSDRNKIESINFRDFDAKSTLARAIYFYLHEIETAQGNSFVDLEFFGQSFRSKFEGNNKRDLVVGCFWDTLDDCDKFLRRIKFCLKKSEQIDRMIVASLTAEHAGKIFDVLEKNLSQPLFPVNAAQYLYAFNDDAFYRRDTRQKVSANDIWGSQFPDPEPTNGSDNNTDETFDDEKIDNDNVDPAVKDLVADRNFYCATAYLKVRSANSPEAEHIYRQLAFAVDDPFLNEGYSADAISSLADKDDGLFNESLIIAASLRALFYNDFVNDYGVPALHALISGFDLVKKNAPLVEFIGDLKNFKTTTLKGVDFYADYRTLDKAAAEKNLAKVIHDAQDFYTHFFEGQQRDNADNETFIRMRKIIFDRNGDPAQIFRAMADKNEAKSPDTLRLVKDFLSETFIKDDTDVDIANLDAEKLTQYIDDTWDAASEKKNPGKLIGRLRNNITKTVERAIEIMCAWVKCAEIFSAQDKDNGRIEYKKIRPRLMENLSNAYANLRTKFSHKTFRAIGLAVVEFTLRELFKRLDGSYKSSTKKYFYVDFLRGDKIVLDENYLPKLDLNVDDGTNEGIAEQILAHAATELPSFDERIEQIFEFGGDDFGSAQLIDDYIRATEGTSPIESKDYDLQKCITSAAKDAPRYRESFIGGLELAQSYGQFDTADDGEKERILQLAENCYKYAEHSKNFGVFFRVKKHWERVIDDNAAKRGEILKQDLQVAIDGYKHVVEHYDSFQLQESVNEIERIIDSRNCTVARSLIRKLAEGELYQKFGDNEETALVRFIADYADCYNKVSDNSYSLENLLGKKIYLHDKVSRAKLNLLKNWITNPVGEDRIKTLLELFGFDVTNVLKISAPANVIAFNVRILKSELTKYYHPIAAFGSDAEVDGFRVACIFGRYDEKSLLAKFKELGNAKHTLVLLDYSLDLPTRRRLAKEIKLDKSLTKVFALVDRVTVMYLLKNCAAQIGSKRINDTLMSLIMPFARYQPYIWSPRTPLPPEMFIGREAEMNDVTNQGGVNIVCGGRQLGKSALLKMACRKIDGHDNERAIYLEIIDKNYREAAILTSRELSDRKFFAEPFETDDWDELARAIKNRLRNSVPTKIPYFLLMLDEADEFIESCKDTNYAPIVALAKIQQENYDGSRFKFVIAGLRNIIRFEREKVFSNNNILPTLRSLTIKPFGLEDARKLLEVPLRYLGLYFPDADKDSLILTILETANYYPSLIQLYCEKLLTALFETSYAGYNADTPVYEISEDHIKKVLADKDFTKDIKTKIEITLGLGTDNYYHTIANLLAYLYYTQNNVDGYTPQDILRAAGEFGLVERKILPDSDEKIAALMEELCELNIMRKTSVGRYLFSRQRILRIVGTINEVEDALLRLMTG